MSCLNTPVDPAEHEPVSVQAVLRQSKDFISVHYRMRYLALLRRCHIGLSDGGLRLIEYGIETRVVLNKRLYNRKYFPIAMKTHLTSKSIY